MTTEQYSHILDEDRRANAARVDERLYKKVKHSEKNEAQSTAPNPNGLLMQIFTNPEMGKAFQAFLQQYQSNT